MNRTKIDWCDCTWNPVTGCLHGCEYCYAIKIAGRFGPRSLVHSPRIATVKGKTSPFPYGFVPTLYEERLDEPKKFQKPSNVFVVSMGDLFGDWVPAKWIMQVLDSCLIARQHRFLFLTKNPARYKKLQHMAILPQTKRFWYGTSTATSSDIITRGLEMYQAFDSTKCKSFISIEPMQEKLDDVALDHLGAFDWVIVGAETGNRMGKVKPERDWILDIVKTCWSYSVPVFMKESLRQLMGDEFVQEFPKELKKGSAHEEE